MDAVFEDEIIVPGVAAVGETDEVHGVCDEDEARGVRVVG